MSELDRLVAELRACRLCRDTPRFGPPLPHEPRPIIQIAPTARLLIASQAPGTRAHASGQPFTDASGDRLRSWLGLDMARFYDAAKVAIVPMGHCFPASTPRAETCRRAANARCNGEPRFYRRCRTCG